MGKHELIVAVSLAAKGADNLSFPVKDKDRVRHIAYHKNVARAVKADTAGINEHRTSAVAVWSAIDDTDRITVSVVDHHALPSGINDEYIACFVNCDAIGRKQVVGHAHLPD